MTEFRPGGFQQLPMVVKNLIIINALVFLLRYVMAQRGIDLDSILGLHYWQSPLFRWWQLFTHMFMHGSIAHIFFNMFALWMFGRILENIWGPQRFLIFYLVCGLGAAACHLGVLTFEFTRFHNAFLAFQQNPTFVEFAQFVRHQGLSADPGFLQLQNFWAQNPNCSNCSSEAISHINEYYSGGSNYPGIINEATIGASGAVFGLLFAFGYLFPNAELMLIFPPIPLKAKWFVAIYALFELGLGIQNSAGDNVAHFAHLGGMLFAFILLRIWNKRIRNRFY